jgi:hypothetical protein
MKWLPPNPVTTETGASNNIFLTNKDCLILLREGSIFIKQGQKDIDTG